MHTATETVAITNAETLTKQLAALMPGFEVTKRYDHLGFTILRRLSDGVLVGVSAGGWKRQNRFVFDLEWPFKNPGTPGSAIMFPSDWNKKAFDNPTTEITVAKTTPLPKIVKAIETRLLTPRSVALWKSMEAHATAAQSYENTTKANIARFEAIGAGRHSSTGGDTLYPSIDGIYKIQVSGGNATLELRSLPVETALAVVELIKARAATKDAWSAGTFGEKFDEAVAEIDAAKERA